MLIIIKTCETQGVVTLVLVAVGEQDFLGKRVNRFSPLRSYSRAARFHRDKPLFKVFCLFVCFRRDVNALVTAVHPHA